MRRRIGVCPAGLIGAMALLACLPAIAQTIPQRTTFIDPFPKDDTYRLHLVGDWFADGLFKSVKDALVDEGQIRVQSNVVQIRSLRRSSWDRQIGEIEGVAKSTPIDIAVVMFGAAELGSLTVPGRRRVRFATEEWKRQYVRRIDGVMKALRRTGAAVYWMGLPTLRREDRNRGAQFINEIIRERAYINGVKYIDTYAGFADENGGYNAYGPDLTGKIRVLRSRDGIYFTSPGYSKLAHFAERAIKRDLRKAKAERTVPLAGSELEQSRVNPKKAAAQTSRQTADRPATRNRPTISRRIGSTTTGAPDPVVPAPGLKDQRADDGVVALRSIQNGVAKTEKIKILRPAISAAVLALLTRKQSSERAARLGDNVAVELSGGLIALSSVTTLSSGPASGRRGRLSPSQSPFFKVWAKGERLTPRPGRADDIEWPRPEPQPVVRARFEPTPRGAAINNDADFRQAPKLTPFGFPPLPDRRPGVGSQ